MMNLENLEAAQQNEIQQTRTFLEIHTFIFDTHDPEDAKVVMDILEVNDEGQPAKYYATQDFRAVFAECKDSTYKYKPLAIINRPLGVRTSEIAAVLIEAFELVEMEPLKTVYSVERFYGGPEEGGWWYNHYEAIEPLQGEEAEHYPRSRVVYEEMYFGQHNTTERPYYC